MTKHKNLDEATLKAVYAAVGLPFDWPLDLFYVQHLRALGFATPDKPSSSDFELLDALDRIVLRLKNNGQKILQRFEKTGKTPSLSEAADAWLLPRQRFGLLNFELTLLHPPQGIKGIAQKAVNSLSANDIALLRQVPSFGPKTVLEIGALSAVFSALKQLRQSPKEDLSAVRSGEKDKIVLFQKATGLSFVDLLRELKTPCSRRHLIPIFEVLAK